MIGTRLGWMQKENREFYSLKIVMANVWDVQCLFTFLIQIQTSETIAPVSKQKKQSPGSSKQWCRPQLSRLYDHPVPGLSEVRPLSFHIALWASVKIILYYFTTITEESIKDFLTRRHEKYRTQYRAMFVMNCTVNKEEVLRYKTTNKRKEKRHRKKARQESTSTSAEAEMESDAGLTDARLAGMNEEEIYHPVKCTECSTEVAVYDKDEVYHFFNTLASYC